MSLFSFRLTRVPSTFTYNATGNRFDGMAQAFAVDSGGTLRQGLVAYWPMEEASGTRFDALGTVSRSTTGQVTRTYRYDPEDRLISVSGTGSSVPDTILTYTYDPSGRRITKHGSRSTIHYLYDGQQILTEYTATGNLMARYIHGPGIDEPLLMVRGGRFAYFHQDGLGSVVAATDSRGVLVEQYRYRAFGEVSILNPASSLPLLASRIGNPYLFTGREWDPETGLYHYRRRNYNPATGRFLSRDPLGGSLLNPQSWHRYSYAENNPINRLDPLGLRAEAPERPSRLEQIQTTHEGALQNGGNSIDDVVALRERDISETVSRAFDFVRFL